MRPIPPLRNAALAGLATSLFTAVSAEAADCHGLPNPVYVSGSSAAKPLLAELAKILAGQADPTTIIYLGAGSCTGVDAILNGTPIKGSGSTAPSYWDSTGAELKCDIVPEAGAVTADIGVSDVYASTCVKLSGGLPTNVGDFHGPIQTMTFVVPKSSSESSLSAEAAYNIYGFGADSGVTPWTDESAIFRRDDKSGTQRLIATAIGVDASRWKGTATTSSTDLRTKLTASAAPSQAIGILATDVADDFRTTLKVLAFQDTGQTCGFYPDRDASSKEKQNVRDGHYSLWGPLHFFSKVNASGNAPSQSVADVIQYMIGTKAPPSGLDLVLFEAQRHVVPQCAMRVTRTTEMGAMSSFAPPGACGCYYDQATNGNTSCKVCTRPSDCPATAPVCSYGYCETQ